jgi:HAMP domain-containing protein
MDHVSGSAIAALTGSAIGGLTPILSAYLIQRGLTERETISRELAERQTLYSNFIDYAMKIYVTAITSKLENLDELVGLYSLISRIRLVATDEVIKAAEAFASSVLQRFDEPAKSVDDLRVETTKEHLDPLHDFSRRCREELRSIVRPRPSSR